MNREPEDITILRTDPSLSSSWSPSGSGEADAPRVLKQRFVLEEKLGSGGMGTVFRAKDLRKVEARDRQPYLAIKVLNNDFREHPEAFIALQREAAKSQTLSHQNIVSIYDFDKDGDVPFMTMELLEGQELAELLRAYPSGLPSGTAWEVIRGICAGLQHAHEAGIVHADFKPGNVFVAASNAPKILDFGIARAVQLTETQGDDTLFDPSRLAALTPAYASREMLAGEIPEPRDDLYSLGVVIYLVLTGRHPFNRLSAEEAARKGLRPERPKGTSRRQWQIINRCLSFAREDRPDDVSEVERHLLTPSPWPSRVILAATALLTLALLVNLLIDDAELAEVKQNVRHSTLLDSQLERIATLLKDPTFDPSWESLIRDEFAALQALEQADDSEAEQAARIRQVYSERILAVEDINAALALLERGEAYGALPRAARALEARSFNEVRILLDNARPQKSWLTDLKKAFGTARAGFADSTALAELDLEVSETLEQIIHDALAVDQLEEAELLLSELSPRLFDAQVLNDLQQAVANARSRHEALSWARQVALANQAQFVELDNALAVSCLRIDLAQVEELAGKVIDPAVASQKISARLGACLVRLAELDPDRAASLHLESRRRFGDNVAIAELVLDPCGLSYLVGNGGRTGRQGYCADQVAEEVSGPRLVVLATADGANRFAMTKQEISWDQFRAFCEEQQEACRGGNGEPAEIDGRLPVTGVSLATVRAYARWLSEATGYTYRLPTKTEWLLAAKGEPDPNRNCQVQLAGVQRGLSPVAVASGQGNEYGLLNMLGNIQEWVLDGDRLVALGGSFSDPIKSCVAGTERVHDGRPALDTGFRLVREVS